MLTPITARFPCTLRQVTVPGPKALTMFTVPAGSSPLGPLDASKMNWMSRPKNPNGTSASAFPVTESRAAAAAAAAAGSPPTSWRGQELR